MLPTEYPHAHPFSYSSRITVISTSRFIYFLLNRKYYLGIRDATIGRPNAGQDRKDEANPGGLDVVIIFAQSLGPPVC